jgi:hypothetical protein
MAASADMTTHLALAAMAELDNEAFQQAIIRLEETQMDIIRASKAEDVETREYAYRMLRVISDFVNELKAMTTDAAHERGRAQAAQMMKQ